MSSLPLSLKDRARFQSLSRLFSARFGIMSWLDMAAVTPADAEVFLLKLGQADLTEYGGVNSFATACSPSFRQALYGAFGEALERYAAFIPRNDEYLVGSYRELAAEHPVTAPSQWPLFRDEQFQSGVAGLERWTETTPIVWIRTMELGTGGAKWVPVDGALEVDRGDERFRRTRKIDDLTSSGAAAGPSFEAAAVGAIHELIERDGIMWHWWRRESPPSIDWLPLLQRPEFEVFRKLAAQVRVLDLRTELGVPSVLAAFLGKNSDGDPALLVGGAAAATIEVAIHKALSEMAHLLIRARAAHSQRMAWNPPEQADEVSGFFQHVLCYHREEFRERADFLFSSDKVSRLNDFSVGATDPERRLAELALEFQRTGLRVSLADLSTPDVREVGAFVVRAFSPDLVPLNARHRYRYWARPRLGTGPLNPHPHPFP